MSSIESHKGTLIKLNTDGLTPEEVNKIVCGDKEFPLTATYDSYAKLLPSGHISYKLLNGNLYLCSDTSLDDEYIAEMEDEGDGMYSYITRFYNGGTYLDEVLEDMLNDLK